MDQKTWEANVQSFEAHWWGDCANTYGEETKQIAYAKGMNLDPGPWRGGDHWPIWNMGNAKILDIGGGPSSMLLKSDFGVGVVVDPCPYPGWVAERYKAHGVEYVQQPAEEFLPGEGDEYFDEAWMYNVLQHTINPEAIVRGMRRVAKRVRIFEWIDTPPHPGHPHTLTVPDLESWVAGTGHVVWLDDQYKQIHAGSRSPVRQPAWCYS